DAFCQQKTPLERLFQGTRLFLVLPQLSGDQRRNLALDMLAECIRHAPQRPSIGFLTQWFAQLCPTHVPVLVSGHNERDETVVNVSDHKGEALTLIYTAATHPAPYLQGPRQIPVMSLPWPILNSQLVYPHLEKRFGERTTLYIFAATLAGMLVEM